MLKHNKAQKDDNIAGGILQDGEDAIIQVLTDLFNTFLHFCQAPKAQKSSDCLDTLESKCIRHKNYVPISLLPIMYKVFSSILLQSMIHTLQFHQPRKQAGFRTGYSILGHLQIVSQLQGKDNEYNITPSFSFVRNDGEYLFHCSLLMKQSW